MVHLYVVGNKTANYVTLSDDDDDDTSDYVDTSDEDVVISDDDVQVSDEEEDTNLLVKIEQFTTRGMFR